MLIQKLRERFSDDLLVSLINVTSSSVYDTDSTIRCSNLPKYKVNPNAVIIGNKDKVWGTNSNNNQWLEIDLSMNALIRGIALSKTSYCNYPTSFDVNSYDLKNKKWVTVLNETNFVMNEEKTPYTLYFKSVITNKIKINFHNKKSSSNNDNYITLYSIDFDESLFIRKDTCFCKKSSFLMLYFSMNIVLCS